MKTIFFTPPQNLIDSRDFCRILLPSINLFLLMDKEIKGNYKDSLHLWTQEEQTKTLAFMICTSQLDKEMLDFLLSYLKDDKNQYIYIPEQPTSPEKIWKYLLVLCNGILEMDMGFFPPSQLGFLVYPHLDQAIEKAKILADSQPQTEIFHQYLQSIFGSYE